MINREKFVNRTARLLGGKNRSAATLIAFVALLCVTAAGAFLAARVDGVREKLASSHIVPAMTAPDERGLLTQLLADPESSVLLLKYIDSLAGAVSNMEVSTKWRISQFGAILNASVQAGVTIDRFACDEQGSALTVYCTGPGADAAELFSRAVTESECFYSVTLPICDNEKYAEFTIICSIS